MIFPYFPNPTTDKNGNIIENRFFPVIPVRIIYNHRVGRPIRSLLDSGSDRNLFPAAYAELVGIPVKKGRPLDIIGIGNSLIKAYTWEVKLYVESTSFITKIDFSYAQQIPLLGRDGFFNHFAEVTFREKEKKVILVER